MLLKIQSLETHMEMRLLMLFEATYSCFGYFRYLISQLNLTYVKDEASYWRLSHQEMQGITLLAWR